MTNFNCWYRAPAPGELYSFGPHTGTATFDVGDRTPKRERSIGKGLAVRPEALFGVKRDAGDVFVLETPTDGYGLFNLNDKLYRNHLSFIKDLAPEPGRGARFGYTVRLF